MAQFEKLNLVLETKMKKGGKTVFLHTLCRGASIRDVCDDLAVRE